MESFPYTALFAYYDTLYFALKCITVQRKNQNKNFKKITQRKVKTWLSTDQEPATL